MRYSKSASNAATPGCRFRIKLNGMRCGRAPFRRYIVKRIALDEGVQLSFDGGGYRYWIF